jgi:hypothetical protein
LVRYVGVDCIGNLVSVGGVYSIKTTGNVRASSRKAALNSC